MSDATRVMVDIETLGTEPGSVILSIGSVKFERAGLGETFYRVVDVESCQDAGLEIDAETLSWWWDQDEAAREAVVDGDELADVLDAFAHFYNGCEEIWANSPAFDVELLRAAYEAVGRDTPWDYWQTRDVRTIMSLPVSEALPHDGVDHHALDDAKQQARNVAAALNEVKP